jgi:4'-phosphopantetheinyl transferase
VISSGSLELYGFALDVPAAVVDRVRQVLAPDELSRAQRFHFAPDAARYIVGRGALRIILGGCIGEPPERIAFVYGPHGKPAIADHELVCFNFSRSGAFALLAIQPGADVGVDVEQIRPLPDALAIASSMFAPDEVEALRGTVEPERTTAFFRYWTCKEAIVKSLGVGLSRRLDDFSLVRPAPDAPREVTVPDTAGSVSRWLLPLPEPRRGYVAAVAAAAPVQSWRCWTWRLDG